MRDACRPTEPRNARGARTRFALASALAALAFAGAAATASAALYKWTDANGRVVYSDQPPVGVKSEALAAPPPPSNPNAAKELANKDAELRKRQTDRAEDAKKADKARADADRTKDFCSRAKNQLMTMTQRDVPVWRLNDKGERVLMEDAERKREADRVEQMMREQNCQK